MAGEIDMMFENLPSVLGQIQGGAVKALAVTSRQRSTALPAETMAMNHQLFSTLDIDAS